jgi:hypothetical protein
MRFMSAILLGGKTAFAIIPRWIDAFGERLARVSRKSPVVRTLAIGTGGWKWPMWILARRCVSRDRNSRTSKQKRGSNQARYGIIRRLKPFRM